MPVLADHDRDESDNRHHTSKKTKAIMQSLLVLPSMLIVAVQDNLRHRNHSPTKPHEPAMHAHDALLCVESGAVTSLAIQPHVEKAVVLVMIRQSPIEVECIHHLDICVERDIVVCTVAGHRQSTQRRESIRAIGCVGDHRSAVDVLLRGWSVVHSGPHVDLVVRARRVFVRLPHDHVG